MVGLEDEIGRIENPDVRSLVQEAYRCFGVGATRACISLTWTAVCTDVIDKIIRLSEDGEGRASKFASDVEKARTQANETAAIQQIQAIERSILESAQAVELVDGVEKGLLERLRLDRNLSSHPSYRQSRQNFEPSQEYARAHLSMALETLLTRTHVQGSRVFDRFNQFILDPSFSATSSHINATYFDPVQPATRNRIIENAVKHALLEVSVPGQDAILIADRMSSCLRAFAQRAYNDVAEKFAKHRDRFRQADGEVQIRALVRVSAHDAFWDSIDEPLAARLNELVTSSRPTDPLEDLSISSAGLFGVAASARARSKLPDLQGAFDSLSAKQKGRVIAGTPNQYFTGYLPQLIAEAPSWRRAEELTRDSVIPCARDLGVSELEDCLIAWANNGEARNANAMPSLAIELFTATRHLEWDDLSAWKSFYEIVDQREPEHSQYRYAGLRAALAAAYGEDWEVQT